jgi:hypothetical protein
MKNIWKYVWMILVFIILATFCEILSYTIFKVTTPAGFGPIDLAFMIPHKILMAFIFILMFRLASGSKLAKSGLLYGFLWFLGSSIPGEVGFWLVFKYELVMLYAGLLSGLLTLITWGWMVKRFT